MPQSSSERIAESIVKAILRRELHPGQRLVEADLTAQLGVSRTTVREALRILSLRGIVQLTPNRGASVRVLDRADAEGLLDVLEALTGLAARLAARRIDIGNHRARFLAASRKLTAADSVQALERMPDERAHYYRTMIDIAGNPELDHALPSQRANLFRSQFYRLLTAADRRAMVREYQAIERAVLAGDEQAAERQARRHIRNTAARVLPRAF